MDTEQVWSLSAKQRLAHVLERAEADHAGSFLTPDALVDAAVNRGEKAVHIVTRGWVSYQTAKDIMARIGAKHPGIVLQFTACANGLECGFVPTVRVV